MYDVLTTIHVIKRLKNHPPWLSYFSALAASVKAEFFNFLSAIWPAMDNVFEKIAELNKLIHEPARLSILTALSACVKADFTFLQQLTGLSKGNLSSHLSKLEDANLIHVTKTYDEKRPITYLKLTKTGQQMIENHWKNLNALRDLAENWRQDK